MPTAKIETFQINQPLNVYVIHYDQYTLISLNKNFQPFKVDEEGNDDGIFEEPFALKKEFFLKQMTDHETIDWIQDLDDEDCYYAFTRAFIDDYHDGYQRDFEGDLLYPLKDALDAKEDNRLFRDRLGQIGLLFNDNVPEIKNVQLAFFSGEYDLRKLQSRLEDDEFDAVDNIEIVNTPTHAVKSGEQMLICTYAPTVEQWTEWMRDAHDDEYPDQKELENRCQADMPGLVHCIR